MISVMASGLVNPTRHGLQASLAAGLAFALCTVHGTFAVATPDVENPTGLPLYPNLDHARLEDRLRTDGLGRWCVRFSARSQDSLATVESWYRRALPTAGETDLDNDGDYRSQYADIDGIKLAVNLAFVAVYKPSRSAATAIELVRCGPVR